MATSMNTRRDLLRTPPPAARRGAGFTLIELLVVVAILALLMGILVPSLRAARDSARCTKCMANLRAIGIALVTYADEHHQQLPSYVTMGKYGFRVAPGNSIKIHLPGGPGTSPYRESWGLQAVLETGGSPPILPNGVALYVPPGRAKYLDGHSKVWICPANPGPTDRPDWHDWGNTYTYRQNSGQNKPEVQAYNYNIDWLARDAQVAKGNPIVWDSYNKYPGIPGFIGPFDRFTIDERFQQAPHRRPYTRGGPSSFWIAFYAGGHCQMNAINKQ